MSKTLLFQWLKLWIATDVFQGKLYKKLCSESIPIVHRVAWEQYKEGKFVTVRATSLYIQLSK